MTAYAPDTSTLSNCVWQLPNFPADAVDSYNPTLSSSNPQPSSASLAAVGVKLYYIKAESAAPISVTCQLSSGVTLTATTTYTIAAPSATVSATYGPVSVDQNIWTACATNAWCLHFGNGILGKGSADWTYSVSSVPPGGDGKIAMFQTVNSTRSQTNTDGTVVPTGTNGEVCSDTSVPYDNITTPTSGTFRDEDAPGKTLLGLDTTVSDQFVDYFMYQPSGGIWITLASLQWNWKAGAIPSGNNWIFDPNAPPTTSTPNTATPYSSLPVWNCSI